MPAPAALGFKLHTGWAVLVALAGDASKPDVLMRRRIELLPQDASVPRFVYHEAAKLSVSQAVVAIRRAEGVSLEATRHAVDNALADLRALDRPVQSAGLSSGSKPVPENLATVLGSHPLIHTAEAALFRQAVASACGSCGLKVVSVQERKVWTETAATWGVKEALLQKRVGGLRKTLGAPWSTDQKTAAAFALLALRHNS